MQWYLSYLSPTAIEEYEGWLLQEQLPPPLLAPLEWQPVEVPSSVQSSAFGLPLEELYQRDNIQQVAWMRECYWLYRMSFVSPVITADEEAIFVFKGIDYKSHLYLNGRKVAQHEGMFSPITIPLVSVPAGSAVEILVVIEPFVAGELPYETLKARYSMGDGWDFAPKLLSAGIWDEAGLEIRKKLRVLHAHVKTTLSNQQRADTLISLQLSEYVDYGSVTVELDGVRRSFPLVQTDHLALPLHIPSPTLWWPNGQGEPRLVTLQVDLHVAGRETACFVKQVGLRAIEYQPCSGQGTNTTPLQLCINGKKVFLKGVNWVPMDACPGNLTRARYQLFLSQLQQGGVNFIRVWGGGLREREDFYALADEYGLMVMQEFPLSVQRLARTERFYRLLVQEVSAIILTLKHHPCVVLWSGGNEHYHYWDSVDSGTPIMESIRAAIQQCYDITEDNRAWQGGAATYDEPSLALMGHLCAALDGSRPYHITSALEGEGDVHGTWTWNPRIGDHRYRDYNSLYDFWRTTDQHLYSEAGLSSIANPETIRRVFGLAEDEALPYPDKQDSIWELHHAFRAAWDGFDDLWLDLPSTEKLFGRLERVDELIFANQWLQGEGGRFLVEETRRKMGHTSGIIWWCVNETWPNLAGNDLLDYYGRPKLAWSFISNAFRPTILTLRYHHCVSRSVKPELWLCHDEHTPFNGSYLVTITRCDTGESQIVQGRIHCPGYTSLYIQTLPRTRLPAGARLHIACQLFTEKGDARVHENHYVFASNEDPVPFDRNMRLFMQELFVHPLCLDAPLSLPAQ